MATWTVGNTLQWGLRVYDTDGALADLGGGDPTATITLPDGTTTAGSVARTATGTYTASLISTQAGRHLCTWDGSGQNSGRLPFHEPLDVWPADPRLIISLADARAALNIPASQTVNDDEVRAYIAAATEVIEDVVGPVLVATRVETLDGRGRSGLPLGARPTSVTTVTEDGTTLPATGYCVDGAGILWRGSSPGAGVWSSLTPQNVVATYEVGAAVIPPNIILAARELVGFQYRQQQTPRPNMGALADPGTVYGFGQAGYAVPNRVLELLSPQRANRMPGIA